MKIHEKYLEKQRFNFFLYIILIIPFFILLYGIYKQLILKISFGTKPLSSIGLIFITILYAILITIFILSSLKTYVNTKGITIVFFPFFINKTYKWTEIKSIEIIKYNPLKNYLGWGIRYNPINKTYAYTTKGNFAVYIILNSGKKILLGTQIPSEMDKNIRVFYTKI